MHSALCYLKTLNCDWKSPSIAIAPRKSLAKAAALAGISWERMWEILLSRGIQPRLGPETEEEALDEIKAMEKIASEDIG